MHVRFQVGRAPEDPEKAVLPALVFCSAGHPDFAGYGFKGGALGFGWWDFYVRVALYWTPA